MENNQHKWIAVDYTLYTVENGERELFEQTRPGEPFTFVSNMGLTLPLFEQAVLPLHEGDTFSLDIPCAEAYGAYEAEQLVDLPRNIFEVDGKFDAERVKEGAVVPLVTAEGGQLQGIVQHIGEESVTIDFNHPLAGADLHFEGKVVAHRDATAQEVAQMATLLEGGCGCDHCGEHEHEHGCGCGCH